MLSNELIAILLLFAAIGLTFFGHSRLTAIRKVSNNKLEQWFPGLALGLGVAILALLLFVYFKGLYRLAQLDSAILTVRELVAAETRFAKSHPHQGYTCNLSELPTEGWVIDKSEVLIKSRHRNGYSFEIVGCQKDDGKPNLTYKIIARPLSAADLQGGDNVCADQSGIVRFYDPNCDQK